MQNSNKNLILNVHSRDVVAVYYLLTFLFTLSTGFLFPIYVIFLLKHGLDLFQVNLVNVAFMLGNFIFEIPTGAYADFFGRRKSVIISAGLFCAGLFFYSVSTIFWMFVIAELISALANTFMSGALDAWMVDNFKSKEETSSIFAKSEIVIQSAAIVAGLIGAYLGSINLALPFIAGGIISLVTMVVAYLFMHDDHIIKSKTIGLIKGLQQMKNIAQTSIEYGIKHKVVFWMVLSSALIAFAFMPLNMYWAPRFSALAGNQIWVLGWIWAGISLFMMFGNILARRFLKQNKSNIFILIVAVFLVAVPLLVSSLSNVFAIALTSFLIYEVGRGLSNPIRKSVLNKHIPSDHRATVLSFDSMIAKLASAIGLVVLGWVAKNYGIQTSWVVSSFLILLLIPIYMRAFSHEKKILEN